MELSDLKTKVENIEDRIKEQNNGQLPEAPRTWSQKIDDLLAQKPTVEMQPSNPISTVFKAKKFETNKRISDIKQIKSGIDQVSALMHITREEF